MGRRCREAPGSERAAGVCEPQSHLTWLPASASQTLPPPCQGLSGSASGQPGCSGLSSLGRLRGQPVPLSGRGGQGVSTSGGAAAHLRPSPTPGLLQRRLIPTSRDSRNDPLLLLPPLLPWLPGGRAGGRATGQRLCGRKPWAGSWAGRSRKGRQCWDWPDGQCRGPERPSQVTCPQLLYGSGTRPGQPAWPAWLRG